ncbi:DUF4340 domain-containing protein [Stratiformator vulcanicus]|uniref:DUF4340 domain-containing protein n=1 Tax=Stratiformator vulcanicus TaxID=2527980 RepID=A0A517R3P2_9PLAN|nr:DUF4340 domain-containing protein [Stratiformator vulcanicus]QDT38512.1 hypothetical protein Pan189_29060 [Stratiformator vulcanicus]
MNEWVKTGTFLGGAILSIAVAFGASYATAPGEPPEYEKVGKAYFPDFSDPFEAAALEVVTYDEETTERKTFRVAQVDGLFRISPHDYPADAAEKLADTATSFVGIKRGPLVSRRSAEHERYGVIDPLSDADESLRGRGQRLTVQNAAGDVLADFIVGKALPDDEGVYLRRGDEDEVFIADLDIDLSTKFSDWVNADVLEIESGDVKELVVEDYEISGSFPELSISPTTLLVFDREESSGPWTLEGVDEATEQVNRAAVNGLVRNLNSMEIVGVRPKPEGLTADLRLDPQVVRSQREASRIGLDLIEKGFIITEGEKPGEDELLAKQGQVTLKTDDGVAYDVYFGDLFTGTEFDVEFGASGDQKSDEKGENSSDDSNGESVSGDESDDGKLSSLKSRYVFVAARLAADMLGEIPSPPEKSEPDSDTGETDADAEGAGSEESESEPSEAEKARENYETAKAEYDRKLTAARDKVEELNSRFGDWYYVISAQDFEEVKLSRGDLVEAKEAEPADSESPNEGGTPSGTSSGPSLQLPGLDTEPEAEPEKEKEAEADTKPPATISGADEGEQEAAPVEAGRGPAESGDESDDTKSENTESENTESGDGKSDPGDANDGETDGSEPESDGPQEEGEASERDPADS